MSDYLSKKAKITLETGAKEEAARSKSPSILPEHAALAILSENAGVTGGILSSLGVDARSVRALLEGLVDRGSAEILESIPLSDALISALTAARMEASILGSRLVETEHIFLRVFSDMDGVVYECLEKFGVTPDDFRIALSERNRDAKTTPHIEEFTGDIEPKEKRRESALKRFCRDLTALAEAGKLSPVTGRAKEEERVLRALCRKNKNNPVIIGEAGVGKTALVESLALRLTKGKSYPRFKNARIYALDTAALVAGARYRGDFEERLQRLLFELKQNKNAIIFIDEIHTLVGTGSGEGSLDAVNMLKPDLARGEIRCIGATTVQEYHKHIEKDAALERRLSPIYLREPTEEETYLIVKSSIDRYETTHQVTYEHDAIREAVTLAARHFPHRRFPDKAFDIIDEAGAKKTMESGAPPHMLVDLEKKALFLEEGLDGDAPEELKLEMRALKQRASQLKEEWAAFAVNATTRVTKADIRRLISDLTEISERDIDESAADKVRRLQEALSSAIIGQEFALNRIMSAVKRQSLNLIDEKRPRSVLLFAGPPGTGKTLTAQTLAKNFYGENSLIRMDMSAYAERHDVARITGSPPGYEGHSEGAFLAGKLKANPRSVILFDEVDKAHASVFNLFLRIFDDGKLDDGTGSPVNFRESIIIMTGNFGVTGKQDALGFASATDLTAGQVTDAVKSFFSTELFDRIDEIIPFVSLSELNLRTIMSLEANKFTLRLQKSCGVTLYLDDEAHNRLFKLAMSKKGSARELRRGVIRELEEVATEALLDNDTETLFETLITDQGISIFPLVKGKVSDKVLSTPN